MSDLKSPLEIAMTTENAMKIARPQKPVCALRKTLVVPTATLNNLCE